MTTYLYMQTNVRICGAVLSYRVVFQVPFECLFSHQLKRDTITLMSLSIWSTDRPNFHLSTKATIDSYINFSAIPLN